MFYDQSQMLIINTSSVEHQYCECLLGEEGVLSEQHEQLTLNLISPMGGNMPLYAIKQKTISGSSFKLWFSVQGKSRVLHLSVPSYIKACHKVILFSEGSCTYFHMWLVITVEVVKIWTQ